MRDPLAGPQCTGLDLCLCPVSTTGILACFSHIALCTRKPPSTLRFNFKCSPPSVCSAKDVILCRHFYHECIAETLWRRLMYGGRSGRYRFRAIVSKSPALAVLSSSGNLIRFLESVNSASLHLGAWAIAGGTVAFSTMASFLVALHVASHTEVLSASLMLTLVRLFSRMRIRVDLEGAWSGKRFSTGWTYISLLSLRI